MQVQRKQLLRPEMCTRGRTGGSIAALIGCRWEKEKIGMPCLQMLAYPVTDADMNTDSMKRFTDTPKWNARSNERMWLYYCGGIRTSENRHRRCMRCYPKRFRRLIWKQRSMTASMMKAFCLHGS